MERIIFELEPGTAAFELRVGLLPAAAGVLGTPSSREIAIAVGTMRSEWFVRFLQHLHKVSPNRAFEVAAVAQCAGMNQDALDFGVNPSDSAELLELRNAMDNHLGWASEEDQERANYAERVREVGFALDALESLRNVRLRVPR